MYRWTYPVDDAFLGEAFVWMAQRSPKLRALHDLLEAVCADPRVQLAVRKDMVPRSSQASWNGRPALPMVALICLTVVRRLMSWSLRSVLEEVVLSPGWRWVCQLYYEKLPNFRTLNDREKRLKPSTIRLINTVAVQLGQTLRVTEAERLRLDGTVIETNIHYPTDSSLLDDAARVISHLLREARGLCQPHTGEEKAWFRARNRQAHHLALQLAQLARRNKGQKPEKTSVRLYAQLLHVVDTLVAQVAQVRPGLMKSEELRAAGVLAELDAYGALTQKVLAQTRQRVFDHKAVPASEKIVSLFEPHTAIICRGKAKPKDVEFGRKIFLGEVDGGLIIDYQLLKGNPPEGPQVVPTVQAHKTLLGKAPREVSGDRGTYSRENEKAARAQGVRRVSLPMPGHKTTRRRRYEKQVWFRAAQRFRNGIEARISQLKRARHLDRCLNHGEPGMERWLGWGVVANNLATLAQFLMKKRRPLADMLKQ
jgi:transposase, IS5 family